MKYEKIYLVNLPSPFLIDDLCQLPAGLLILRQYIRSLGHNIELVNLAGKTESEWEIPPDGDLYGISASTPQFNLAVTAARQIKQTAGAPVVLGGIHGTSLPVRSLQDEPFDIVVIGEGEITFSRIIEGESWESIHGVAFRRNGEIIVNPRRKPEPDIDKFPFARYDDFNLNDYHYGVFSGPRGRNVRGIDIMTSRGCPFSCHFCASPTMWSRRVRFHSAEYVTANLDYLYSLGYNDFFITDDLFSLKLSRLLKICAWLKEHGSRYRCQLRSSSATPEILDLLAESGCLQIDYGVETASQKVLDLINKREKSENHYRAIKLTLERGIIAKAYLLAGLPGETKNTIQDTVRFIQTSGVEFCSVNYFVPLPGCEIFNNADKYGIEIDKSVPFGRYYVAGKEDIVAPVYKNPERTIELGRILLDALEDKRTHIELQRRKQSAAAPILE